jgi:hypothetical protein
LLISLALQFFVQGIGAAAHFAIDFRRLGGFGTRRGKLGYDP